MPALACRVEQPQPDTLALSGELRFTTVAPVLERARSLVAGGAVRTLDLSGVRGADSAGLACVLSLMALAHRAHGRMQVRNVPASLRRLAAVSDVEAWLD